MPSMAPPNRMVRPLPAPDTSPPKMAHSSRSCPAKGEAADTSTGRMFVMTKDAAEYTSTAQMEYTVKHQPCFFRPNRNRGTLRITRNTDRVYWGGVACQSSMAVPDIPLSYRFTGAKNMVTPTALMQPAQMSSRKFCQRSIFSSSSPIRLHRWPSFEKSSRMGGSFFALVFFTITTSRGSQTQICADGSAGPARPDGHPHPRREPCRLPR